VSRAKPQAHNQRFGDLKKKERKKKKNKNEEKQNTKTKIQNLYRLFSKKNLRPVFFSFQKYWLDVFLMIFCSKTLENLTKILRFET
jgi:hypothetical protein